MRKKILLIEDDYRLRRILQLVIENGGYEVQNTANGREGINTWRQWKPDAVVTDLKMNPGDGMAVLEFGKEYSNGIPIIILTAFGTVETAVEAMKNGAFDYLTKPVDNVELLAVITEAVHSTKAMTVKDDELLGRSPQMDKIRKEISLFASTDSSVLISGESGTGKELAALTIHHQSAHGNGPFIRVNCAAIPRDLLESELFGHKKGSFTGATADRRGAFAEADGGTLFLDEVGDLPLELQPKLLHGVEEKSVTPVGSSTPLQISVKIVSASNRNFEKMLAENSFRHDLYYRLNTVRLHMVPLREREGDLNLFLDFYLQLFSEKFDCPQPVLSAETVKLLHQYPWPGNIREMKNVMERIVLTCEGEEVTPARLPSSINKQQWGGERQVEVSSTDLRQQEEQLIMTVLRECNWNQSQAARDLGISRNTLRYRIKKHGLSRSALSL